ncbi:MAG: SEC-C metal-binding domain-containing protein, partial [Elusimicrobiota bacterium]
MDQHRSDKPIRPFDVILEMMKKSASATDELEQTHSPAPRQPAVPSGSQDWARLPDEELVERMFTEADQLPMEFAREVTLRGERIVPALAEVARHECNWHKSDAGWCAPIHATYLLGAIGGESAIESLMDVLRLAEEFEEEWVTEELPSIFGSLGLRALEPLRAVALDPDEDWMLRHTAMAGMAAVTIRRPEEEAEVFQLIGRVASDEAEDDDVRAWAGQILLHFSRREHKGLLLKLVDSGMAEGLYGKWDIRKGMWLPYLVHYRHDWLEFYQPDQISDRRRRRERSRLPEREAWQEALSREWGADPDIDDDSLDNPYDGPDDLEDAPEYALDRIFADPKVKIGRNDPCPCGSGKKFKKCCLNRPAGHA